MIRNNTHEKKELIEVKRDAVQGVKWAKLIHSFFRSLLIQNGSDKLWPRFFEKKKLGNRKKPISGITAENFNRTFFSRFWVSGIKWFIRADCSTKTIRTSGIQFSQTPSWLSGRYFTHTIIHCRKKKEEFYESYRYFTFRSSGFIGKNDELRNNVR